GYSNATYILSMDFDIIKIDKYILWKSEEDECARIVLSNTVKMIKDLKKKILVEGVETQSQRDMMVALGVDYCQGFYFSKPVPQHEFVEFCREFNRSH
ncbi:MAG: EAL domain-containing protein, partial [Treponema sp.]|nr:EAL domain-containing protein [Treponema sp.]